MALSIGFYFSNKFCCIHIDMEGKRLLHSVMGVWIICMALSKDMSSLIRINIHTEKCDYGFRRRVSCFFLLNKKDAYSN